MSEIRDWLDHLGLGQYAEAFEANEITQALLPKLTDDALKELGVAVMGHRMRILEAIASGVAESDFDPAQESADAPTPPREAERRQLTVMFCDLVGSTALSERLDPEDLRVLMTAYQMASGGVIDKYDGHVAQYLGDGLMVYFGWPRAHEDDAERAVRAGLGIVKAVKAVGGPVPLQVRIGIATGPVVVGETGGGDAAVPKAAIGETPNLAARLQGLAGADEVVVAAATHRLIGGVFRYDDLGARALKGIVQPVRAWRVAGESAAEGRFEAQAIGGLTPFVGRKTEAALLTERWRQASDGEGQVVLLSGEPGIGKSRMLRELRGRVSHETHTRLRYQCSPYYTNSAFYPVIDQLERAAGFDRDDQPDAKLAKLETLLGGAGTPTALLAALLSLPLDRYPPLNLSPQRQKDDTIAALADQLAVLAGQSPVLMLFEDAHWCDPTTLEAFGAVIDQLQDLPVLLVITYRPEFEPPWTGHAHVTTHSLNRLSRRLGADLVARVTGGRPLPDEVLNQIVAKTDGVPLFVEELTKTVLEAGFLKSTDDGYKLDGPLPPLAIPATLRDSLMARLDRLSPVKDVAQIGACIGREFSHELLVAVSPIGENELQDGLQQLHNSELIFRRGAPPEATYTFKHALVQDAAYESLLRSKRQSLHTDIARALEQKFPEVVETEPELIARHYTDAGLAEPAIHYWLNAGIMAMERSAFKEARGHLNHGLGLLGSLPASSKKGRLEVDYRLKMGPAIMASVGSSAREAHDNYRRLCQISGAISNDADRFALYAGLGVTSLGAGDFDEAERSADQLELILQDDSDPRRRVIAHNLRGQIFMQKGLWREGLSQYDAALKIHDANAHQRIIVDYGFDPAMEASLMRAFMHWQLGYPDQAKQTIAHTVELAEDIAHPLTMAVGYSYASDLLYFIREPDAAGQYADKAIEVCESQREFQEQSALARLQRAWSSAVNGNGESAIPIMKQALDDYKAATGRLIVARLTAEVAEVCGLAGRADEGLEILANSPDRQSKDGKRSQFPDIFRIEGDLMLMKETPDPTAAERLYDESIRIARGEESLCWELRAAIRLARLWHSQGKRAEAKALLAPVYGRFTEGFDTADLKDAKALLDELDH